MSFVRFAFLLLLFPVFWSTHAVADDAPSAPKPSTILSDMFGWWNVAINSEEPFTTEQFRNYFTEDAVILVNNREQVRGVEHMPAHFQAIRERPGTIEIELPFREEFQSGDRIFTYHRIRSANNEGESFTYNMGYAIIEGDRIAYVSLARFVEE